MRPGGYIVQMLAFSVPQDHLPRYLDNMEKAGFKEVQFKIPTPIIADSDNRIWRSVPNRKWYATLKGKTSGSCEVVLVHKAK